MKFIGMNRYTTLGLREAFLEHFFEMQNDCWSSRELGNLQYASLKVWLKEAEIIEVNPQTDKNGQIIKVLNSQETEKVAGIARIMDFKPYKTKLGEIIADKDDPSHQKVFECINILDKLQMLDKVTMVSAADLSDIKIDYQDRLYIMLGSYEKMEYKLTFIKKVISENLSEYEKAILDYRGQKLYVGPRIEEEPEPEPEETEEGEEERTEESDEKQESEG